MVAPRNELASWPFRACPPVRPALAHVPGQPPITLPRWGNSGPAAGSSSSPITKVPRAWLVAGFHEAASTWRLSIPNRLTSLIPLFDTLNWAGALEEDMRPHADPMLMALRFVRDRVLHAWAVAVVGRKHPEADDRHDGRCSPRPGCRAHDLLQTAMALGLRVDSRPAADVPGQQPLATNSADLRDFRALASAGLALLGKRFEAIWDVVARDSENEPCHARRGRLPSGRRHLPICRSFLKRMMGFEPTTFCMASRRSSQLSYIRAAADYTGGLDQVPAASRASLTRRSASSLCSRRTAV